MNLWAKPTLQIFFATIFSVILTRSWSEKQLRFADQETSELNEGSGAYNSNLIINFK